MPLFQNSTLPVVLNRESGTLVQGPPEKIADLVQSECEKLGFRVEIHLLKPEQIEPTLKELIAAGHQAVLVGGGDGTIMSAARILMGSSCALIPLPFGTVNLITRDLGFPLDPAQAIQALAQAEPIQIDTAELNGHFFLCVSVLGFYPSTAWKLEEFHGVWWKKMFWTLQHLLGAYFKYPALSLDIQTKGHQLHFKTRSLAVYNNPFAETLGIVPKRDDLQKGRLGVYISRHSSWLSLIRGAIAFVFGLQKIDRDLQVLETTEFELRSRRGKKLKVSMDGELYELKQPLRYKIHPESLKTFHIPAPPT